MPSPTTAIPTLSSMGWVNTIEEKGDFVLSWFITAQYSQTGLYHGSIASLAYLVKRYANEPISLQSQTQNALEGLMRRTFGDNTNVVVTVVEEDSELKPGQLTIQFRCAIRDRGLSYSLGRRVEYLNGKLVNIVKINNG